MTTTPVKLTKQWSIEGGRLSKPYGLEVKEIETTVGTVEFVKVDKNADWLLRALFGAGNKGALRMTTLFTTFNTMLARAVADPTSRWTPERAPESSSSSAVAESEAIDPMSQLEEISSENATPKKRKGQGGNITNRSAGRTKSKLSACQSTSLYPTQAGRKSGRSNCFPRARARCGCVSKTFLGS